MIIDIIRYFRRLHCHVLLVCWLKNQFSFLLLVLQLVIMQVLTGNEAVLECEGAAHVVPS